MNSASTCFFYAGWLESVLFLRLWHSPASRVTLRWGLFLSDEKETKESPKEGPSPSLWNPPRFPGLSGAASQAGPKGEHHTRRKSGSPLLFLVAAGVVRHSLVFGPACGAPRPTAAGRGRSPRPEALVEGAETASGVEIAQRCVGPSNQPHQAQGRLGPVQEKNNFILGFPKGSPFGGSLVTFCPSESHPAEQIGYQSYVQYTEKETFFFV